MCKFNEETGTVREYCDKVRENPYFTLKIQLHANKAVLELQNMLLGLSETEITAIENIRKLDEAISKELCKADLEDLR